MKLHSSISNMANIMISSIFLFFGIFVFPFIPEAFSRECMIVLKPADKMSVNLVNVNITEVADILSKKAGIKILLDKNIQHPVTASFQNLPLELGIKKLLGPALNSAFVFVRKTTPDGKVTYPLDTVEIFNAGSRLSADYRIFDKGDSRDNSQPESNTADLTLKSNAASHIPLVPGIIHQQILAARQNMNMIQKRNKMESDYIHQKILRLQMKLSQTSSADERAKILQKLSQAEQELSHTNELNSRLITDEKRNMSDLMTAAENLNNQKKFIERQQNVRKAFDK